MKADLRTVTFDIPSQEVLSKDCVTVTVNAVCYYAVVDAAKSICEVENAHHATVSYFLKMILFIMGYSSWQNTILRFWGHISVKLNNSKTK